MKKKITRHTKMQKHNFRKQNKHQKQTWQGYLSDQKFKTTINMLSALMDKVRQLARADGQSKQRIKILRKNQKEMLSKKSLQQK